MIDSVRGGLLAIEAHAVVIMLDVVSLSFRVECTPATVLACGPLYSRVILFTQLVAVREDLPRLFGFTRESDRELFRALLKVTGIGAGTALKILSAHKDPDTIRSAVRNKDPKALKVKGVGPKIAAKIMAELAGKLGEPEAVTEPEVQAPPAPAPEPEPEPEPEVRDTVGEDAYLALRTLEFDAVEARQRIKDARERLGPEATTDAVVREVLVRL